MTRLSARRAVRVLTISAFSKREIVTHLGVAPDKVEVVYPGITSSPTRASNQAGNLILFVGSLFNRRHLPELIAGFAKLVDDVNH